jgi:hypothetical protein
MIPAQNSKYVIVTSPAAILDNTSATTNSIDAKGWDYLQVVCTVGATDIAMSALKLQTSDTDSSYADLTGAIFGTSTNIDGATSAVPSATDDNKLFVIEVDLRGKKRYFDLVATAGNGTAGTYFSAVAILSKGEIAPITAAGRGADEILRV